MKIGVLAATAVLAAGTGVVFGQPQTPQAPPPAAAPAVAAPAGPVTDNGPIYPPDVLPRPAFPDYWNRENLRGYNRWWADGEYLLWTIRDTHLPPLLTSGSAADAVPAALGQPNTVVILGGEVDTEEQSGTRVRVGYWCDPDRTIGVEGTYFLMAERTSHFPPRFSATVNTSSSNPIGVPFIDAQTSTQSAFTIPVPGAVTGSVAAQLSSEMNDGELSILLRRGADSCSPYSVVFLGGFRFLELDERLQLGTLSSAATSPILSEATFDSFRTKNYFYGLQAGARAEYVKTCGFGAMFVDVEGKLGVGDNHEKVDVVGFTLGPQTASATSGGAVISTPFTPHGLLAQTTNIGEHTHDNFDVVPEVSLAVGVELSQFVRFSVGYTFLYQTTVLRPGDQIDQVINTNPTAGAPLRPTVPFHTTDFWAQALSISLEARY